MLLWESANANANDTLFINKIAGILEKYGMHTPMELLLPTDVSLELFKLFNICFCGVLYFKAIQESWHYIHCMCSIFSLVQLATQFQCLPERTSSIAVYALTGAEPIEVTLDKYCINLFFGIARLDSTIEKQMLLWESAIQHFSYD
jgi:hypothetical protein